MDKTVQASFENEINALPQQDDKKDPHILKARLTHPRAHMTWTEEEDKLLTQMLASNHSAKDMAKKLNRSLRAIEIRIKALEILTSDSSLKENVYPVHKDHAHTLNVLSYWRNSLADSETIGLSTDKIIKGEKFPKKTFEKGQLPVLMIKRFFDEAEAEQTLKNQRKKLKDPEPIQQLSVILAPFTAVKKIERAQQKNANKTPLIIFPLWMRASLTRDGQLIPPEKAAHPWINRHCLTPNDPLTGYPILGDVTDADDFYAQHTELLNETSLSWEKLFSSALKLLYFVTDKNTGKNTDKNIEALFLDQQYALNESGYILPNHAMLHASKTMIKVYDQYLNPSKHKNKKIPDILHDFCSFNTPDYAPDKSVSALFSASRYHTGQMHDGYPLSASQRTSLSYFFDFFNAENNPENINNNKNSIFTIHGPPGTGKTSLLLSIIASKWVDAALQKQPPPIIAAAANNNLGVTNILDAFKNFGGSVSSDLSRRWLPDLSSYGLYLAPGSKKKIKEAEEKGYLYRLKQKETGSLQKFYTDNYHAQASGYFLAAFNAYYQKHTDNLRECEAHLHQEMQRKQALLQKIISENLQYHTLQENFTQHYGRYGTLEKIDDVIALHIAQQSKSQANREKLQQIAVQWFESLAGRLYWLKIFSWIPFIKTFLTAKVKSFTAKHHEIFSGPMDDIESVTTLLNQKVAALKSKHTEIQSSVHALNAMKHAHEQFMQHQILVQETIGFDFFNHHSRHIFDFSDPDGLLSKIDVTLRYELFLLATHYWEAQWLQQSKLIDTLKYTLKDRKKFWEIQAMITPCFLTTLHSGPAYFQHRLATDSFETVSDFIDLLIIDEAGQVLPATAGAMISTAKKALFVGDVQQIEPIFSLTENIDFANAKKFKLCAPETEPDHLKTLGILCSGDTLTGHAYGNLILLGQRRAKHHLNHHASPGMLLKEHRRCAKEIISYCNEMCYDHQLLVMTEEKPSLFPRMGYAHIKGEEKRSGGSRCNPAEAQVIAQWLNKHTSAILKTCETESLDECVGIVTPFVAQASAIKKALHHYHLNITQTGTIHALQGAEKDIIIFSSVYAANPQKNTFFFDISPNMLNVAVSRAKRSFLVFGDMDIFDPDAKQKPSGLLAKYLFAHKNNEIIDIFPSKPVLLENEQNDIILIDSLAHHRQALKESFSTAHTELTIVSPYLSADAIENDKICDLIQRFSPRLNIHIYTNIYFHQNDLAKFHQLKKSLETAGAKVFCARNLHSKMITIDDRIVIIGSFNWLSASRTNQAFIHQEHSVSYQGKHVSQFIKDSLVSIQNKVIALHSNKQPIKEPIT